MAVSPLDISQVKIVRAGQARMRALQPRPSSSKVAWCDRTLSHAGHTVDVRPYAPNAGIRRGALVYFHGGGFVLGDLESEHEDLFRYAEQVQCVVVSVDYRLAPEHPFPAAHDDGWAALQAIYAIAPEFDFDPRRVGLGGASAGAAIALGLALRARDESGPSVSFILLVQPAIDPNGSYPSASAFDNAALFGKYDAGSLWSPYLGPSPPEGRLLGYAAPMCATSFESLPSTCIISGGADPLRDEGLALASRLLDAGTETELHLMPGVPHGFGLVPDASASLKLSQIQIWALRNHLGPTPS